MLEAGEENIHEAAEPEDAFSQEMNRVRGTRLIGGETYALT